MVKRWNWYTKRVPHCPLQINTSIGLSGAKIHDLKNFLKRERIKFDTNIPLVVFIGTNDIFKDSDDSEMCAQYTALLKFLRKSSPDVALILLQLPTYPRAQKSPSKIEKISKFNQFLSTLNNNRTKVFSLQNRLDPYQDFHRFYARSSRVDGIHLNDMGNKKLSFYVSCLLKSS